MRRRVTVVRSVCLLSHISPLEHLFVLKILSHTQQSTEVKKFVGFSLKPLHCRDPALPPLKAYIRSAGKRTCALLYSVSIVLYIAHAFSRVCSRMAPRVLHFSAFIFSLRELCTKYHYPVYLRLAELTQWY